MVLPPRRIFFGFLIRLGQDHRVFRSFGGRRSRTWSTMIRTRNAIDMSNQKMKNASI